MENGNGMTDAKFTFKNNGGISKVYVDDKEVPATEWQKDAEIPRLLCKMDTLHMMTEMF